MKIIGVTGGIGSGKSIVCRIFQQLGIAVYEADIEAKNLYDKYPELKQAVKEQISADAIDKNGNIDRAKLAEIIFSDEEKLIALNKLVHPLVRKDFRNWVGNHKGYSYLIKEAAILFESGADADCDEVISIVSPIELRMERLLKRDKKSKAEIENILKRQMSDEERIARSKYVIHNDEKQMVIPQVLKIHDLLVKENL